MVLYSNYPEEELINSVTYFPMSLEDAEHFLLDADLGDGWLHPRASNYTFVMELHSDKGKGLAVYKPQLGEAPLWDFPQGSLYLRECATYEFSKALKWEIIPPTIRREGEAANELTLIGVGAYGKPLPKQMGAPLRLVVPWKYGFKSIKSIVRFSFTDKRPVSFWETVQSEEYGFWANVNPKVPHARWSQETERVLGGGGKRIKTLIYNGYEEQVSGLYRGLKGESLYY